ncbi:hypothetical protein Sjap_023106 [Stephania japonica]|uniref:Cytochrome P450 n=1 Tax=Stephania japonica TaxID=461633 RepID=A0AAP0EQL7_9MAGN
MELLQVLISIVPLSSLLIAVLLYYYFKVMMTTDDDDDNNAVQMIGGGGKLPPGSRGWPLIGESMELLRAGRNGQVEKFFQDRMSKHSNQAFTTSLFGQSNMVALCGPEAHKFLFSNEHKLVNSWWPRSVHKLFPTTSRQVREDAMRMRSLIMPALLKAEALQRYVGSMDAMARRSVERGWVGKEEVRVFELVKEYAFRVACRLFMSVEDEDLVRRLVRPFGKLAAGIFAVPLDVPGTAYNKAVKASRVIREELRGMVQKRSCDHHHHHHQNGDMLSHMLKINGSETLSDEDVVNKIMGLLIGGHDTATAVITCFIKYMAELPHIYDLVLKEQREIAKLKRPGELLNWDDIQKMRHTWNVACEVMRFWAPVQGAFKEALTDFTYAGFFIPKGFKLYWNVNTTHKNPDYFAEPEKFDPWRFEGIGPAPYTYVPFGGGARTCPGKEYARLEILVFMHNLVNKYRWEKVIADEKIIVDPMPVPTNGLPIRLYPHASLRH